MKLEELPATVKVFAEQPDENTLVQVKELAELPFFHNRPIRIMPDCHSGKGCVVGFSAPYDKCIIPSIIGMDIGCGMLVIKLPKTILGQTTGKECDRKFLQYLDEIVHREIPAGYYGKNIVPGGPTGFHKEVSKTRFKCMLSHLLPYLAKDNSDLSELADCNSFLTEFDYWHKYLSLNFSFQSLMKCCGTLGSGNHFVELDVSDSGEYYLVVHSGSRGLGGSIASKFISAAELITKILLGSHFPNKLLNDESPFFKYLFNQLQTLKRVSSNSANDDAALRLPISNNEKKAFYQKLRDKVKEEMNTDIACKNMCAKEYKTELTRRINCKVAEHEERCKMALPEYDYLRVFPSGITEDQILHYKAAVEKNSDFGCLYPTLGAEDYLRAMRFCQFFAKLNRLTMAFNIYCALLGIGTHDRGIWDDSFDPSRRAQVLSTFMDTVFYTDCIHNYIDLTSQIMRKGSIRAGKDDVLIIPMNMRDGILVCKGLGNPDWNCTAPHGAGRIMSRTQAKKNISLDTVIQQMKNVYSTCLKPEIVDEAPDAYKPMAHITKYIQDTCTITDHWMPLWNFKGMDCVPGANAGR